MKESSILKAEATAVARMAKKIGLSQTHIAIALDASQSQVSRILSGNARRRSRLFNDVCKYVNSSAIVDRPLTVADSDELMSAISAVWDGTPQHAKALALIIRSLGALSPKETGQTTRQPKNRKGD